MSKSRTKLQEDEKGDGRVLSRLGSLQRQYGCEGHSGSGAQPDPSKTTSLMSRARTMMLNVRPAIVWEPPAPGELYENTGS